MKIYFISGLGASCSVFDNLQVPDFYEKIYLEWKQPQKKESLENYALRMAETINTNEEFILAGLSFGGVIAQEIAQLFPPHKLILFSTIKKVKEKPLLFKISKITGAHRYIPMQFFTSDYVISYGFFRKLYSKRMPDLNKIFVYRDPHYLRWSFTQIINWQPKKRLETPIYHLHGTHDPLFPIRKIENAIPIPNGNHLMIILQPKKINAQLDKILTPSKHLEK